MTSFRPFTSFDLLKYNLVNTDALTETYGLSFYLSYLAHWPEYFVCAETLNRELSGYVMGKSEGKSHLFHGHVTAITVAPPYRRQKLANKLMETLEVSDGNVPFGGVFYRFVREREQRKCDSNVPEHGLQSVSKSPRILRRTISPSSNDRRRYTRRHEQHKGIKKDQE